jgi:hypothetical protein
MLRIECLKSEKQDLGKNSLFVLVLADLTHFCRDPPLHLNPKHPQFSYSQESLSFSTTFFLDYQSFSNFWTTPKKLKGGFKISQLQHYCRSYITFRTKCVEGLFHVGI